MERYQSAVSESDIRTWWCERQAHEKERCCFSSNTEFCEREEERSGKKKRLLRFSMAAITSSSKPKICLVCTFIQSDDSAATCEMCGSPLPGVEMIKCPVCTFQNPYAAEHCNMCNERLPISKSAILRAQEKESSKGRELFGDSFKSVHLPDDLIRRQSSSELTEYWTGNPAPHERTR